MLLDLSGCVPRGGGSETWVVLGSLAQFSVFDTQHRIRSTCAQEVSAGNSRQLQGVAFWSSFACTVSLVFSVSGPLVRKLRLWLPHSALCLEQGGQEPEETAPPSGHHVSTKQDRSVLCPALRALGSDYPWQRVGAGKEAAEGGERDPHPLPLSRHQGSPARPLRQSGRPLLELPLSAAQCPPVGS